MKQKTPFVLLLIMLFVLVLSSCDSQETEPPAPTAVADSSPIPEPTSDRQSEPVYGLADVERVEILTLESFPVQVNVRIQGSLPSDCADIDDIVVQRDDEFFNMAVTIVEEPGQDCAEAEIPFEEMVPLDVLGLDAGTYTVTANSVQSSFTLDVDNQPQEETVVPTVEPTTTPAETSTYAVQGRVWHDLCAVSADEDAEIEAGCIVTGEDTVRADGQLDDEPGIEDLRVVIGEGQCPSEGYDVSITDFDGSFLFSDLPAGTYCVAVDSDDEQNKDILSFGEWTAPNRGGDPESTVILAGGDTLQIVNFGWDYEFLPVLDVDLSSCSNSFEFVEDINIPDDTAFSPGAEFTKRWQLRNNGTCPWSSEYSVVFVGGDLMSAEESIPFIRPVAPGELVEVAIDMIAPDEPGTYRGNWQIADINGEPFGINGFIEDAFWLRIEVAEDAAPLATPEPNSGVLGGVVWDDFCLNSDPGRGCQEFPEDSGLFIGNGTLDAGEARLSEITISLAEEACPTDGTLPPEGTTATTTVTDADGLYLFESLPEGTYCVFMDALSEENVDLLIPGNWTWPAAGVGQRTYFLDPGEQALDLDFGWDFAD